MGYSSISAFDRRPQPKGSISFLSLPSLISPVAVDYSCEADGWPVDNRRKLVLDRDEDFTEVDGTAPPESAVSVLLLW